MRENTGWKAAPSAMEPEVEVPFEELPRITRVKVEEKNLVLWFSMPMEVSSLKETVFGIGDASLEMPS